MSNPLQAQIQSLADELAAEVVRAIRATSLDEMVEGETQKRGRGRPPKTETALLVSLIVDQVRRHPGTTGEAARKAIGAAKPSWSLALSGALKKGTLRREGRQRSSRYWVV